MLISDTARKTLFPHFSLLALEVDCKDAIFFLLSAYRILLYFVSVRFGWTCSIYDNITSLANIDSLYRVFTVTYFSWGTSKAKNTLKMWYCDSIYFTLLVFEAVSHNVEQDWPELLAIPLPQFIRMLGMYVAATLLEPLLKIWPEFYNLFFAKTFWSKELLADGDKKKWSFWKKI